MIIKLAHVGALSFGFCRPTAVQAHPQHRRFTPREVLPSHSSYLAAQYHRLQARRGKKRAAVAVGHTILIIAYYLLTRGTVYEDLGVTYVDQRDRVRAERRLVRRLETLGYIVHLEVSAA